MHAKGLGNGDHATPRELNMEGLQKWYRTRSMTEIQPRSFIEHQPGCQYHWHS